MKTDKIIIIIICLFLIASGGLGIMSAKYIDDVTMQEIKPFREFVNNPRNEGQYIMDFDTGIWYDIDGLNPDVPPLTISQLEIKNISDRIIGKSIHSKIADKLFNIYIRSR